MTDDDGKRALIDIDVDLGQGSTKVRKTSSWPRSWANFRLLYLNSHRTEWPNFHLLGQPNTLLAADLNRVDALHPGRVSQLHQDLH
jgi:hypothetical protein